MGDLADLVMLAQDYTWVMVAGIWITVIIGGKMLDSRVKGNGSDIEELAESHQEVAQEVHTIDLKQDHIVERQEMVMETVGVNEQEIQELQQETARLDAQHDEGTFFRGGSRADPGDD